jgi:hypothetical protein
MNTSPDPCPRRAASSALPEDVFVVFSSGYSGTAAIEEAVRSNMLMIRKPFGIEELQAVLSDVLGRRRS